MVARNGDNQGDGSIDRSQVVNLIGGLGLQWQASFGIITLLYFYSHYMFASGAAHIGAMYTAFLSVSIAMGTPPLLAAIALGQLSNVMGCLSTYPPPPPPSFASGRSRSASLFNPIMIV